MASAGMVFRRPHVKLSIQTHAPSHRAIRLVLSGEIDYASSQQLRAAITAALRQPLDNMIISLVGVTSVDLTGIGTLVVAHRICSDLRVNLRVVDVHPQVIQLFRHAGASDALTSPETGWVPRTRTPRNQPLVNQ